MRRLPASLTTSWASAQREARALAPKMVAADMHFESDLSRVAALLQNLPDTRYYFITYRLGADGFPEQDRTVDVISKAGALTAARAASRTCAGVIAYREFEEEGTTLTCAMGSYGKVP